MRFHEVRVLLVVLPMTESGAGAEPALELANSPACPIARCGCEEAPVPLAEAFRDPEEIPIRNLYLLILRAVDDFLWLPHATHILPHRAPLTPLDPRGLLLNSSLRRLLDTWSR